MALRSYFGGRLVAQQSGVNTYQPVIQDRLGSVGKYYPYGEERNSPQLSNDQVKFATYTRDSATGNDYADQRYYTSTLGRFMTVDPSTGSAQPGAPQSWNRYAYTVGDPVNHNDRTGQDILEPLDCFGLEGGDIEAAVYCEEEFEAAYLVHAPDPTPGRYALWSVFRNNINALAVAALAANLQRTAKNASAAQIPTYLQFQSACWTIGVPGSLQGGSSFVLHVTYQVLDQNGAAMSGAQLSTAGIAEQFYDQVGNLGLTPGPNWEYQGPNAPPEIGISPSGTITDLLGTSSYAGFTRAGAAFQTFSAGGIANGVPYYQPLEILGLGPATGVLNNYYDKDYVSINGRMFTQSNTPQCPQ